MDSMTKKTAEELLKIAEEIEQQAAEVTQLVCDKCNHTSTLAKINDARKKTASDVSENIAVSEITVNDKVTCPAPGCDGVLSYKATEASAPYYYDPDAKPAEKTAAKEEAPKEEAPKEEAPKEEEPKEEAPKEEGKEAKKIDYDMIESYQRA
jgi:hypothetical protein